MPEVDLLKIFSENKNFPKEISRSQRVRSAIKEADERKKWEEKQLIKKAIEVVRAKVRQLDKEYLDLMHALARCEALKKYEESKKTSDASNEKPSNQGASVHLKYLKDATSSNLSVLNLSKEEMDKINQTKLSLHPIFQEYEKMDRQWEDNEQDSDDE